MKEEMERVFRGRRKSCTEDKRVRFYLGKHSIRNACEVTIEWNFPVNLSSEHHTLVNSISRLCHHFLSATFSVVVYVELEMHLNHLIFSHRPLCDHRRNIPHVNHPVSDLLSQWHPLIHWFLHLSNSYYIPKTSIAHPLCIRIMLGTGEKKMNMASSFPCGM